MSTLNKTIVNNAMEVFTIFAAAFIYMLAMMLIYFPPPEGLGLIWVLVLGAVLTLISAVLLVPTALISVGLHYLQEKHLPMNPLSMGQDMAKNAVIATASFAIWLLFRDFVFGADENHEYHRLTQLVVFAGSYFATEAILRWTKWQWPYDLAKRHLG